VLRITHRIKALGAVLTTAAAVLLAAAGPAHAEGSAAADATCTPGPSTKPFAAWNDFANYVLVPNGDVRAGDDCWNLTGATVQGADQAHSASLSLPAGASATSGEMSIGLAYPTLRFFARNDAPGDGRLTVQVLFHTPESNTLRQLKIADLTAGTEWQPTRTILILANLLALYPTWDGKVQFRFTASGTRWNIDDVYVDPFTRW